MRIRCVIRAGRVAAAPPICSYHADAIDGTEQGMLSSDGSLRTIPSAG